MKKVISLLLVALLCINLVACASQSTTITIAKDNINYFLSQDDSTIDEYIEELQGEEGIKSAKLDDDGNLIIALTKSKYDKMCSEIKSGIDDYISEILSEENTTIVGVNYSDDLSVINVEITRTDTSDTLNLYDSIYVMGISIMGAMYQSITGVENISIELNYIDSETREIFLTKVFPDESEDNLSEKDSTDRNIEETSEPEKVTELSLGEMFTIGDWEVTALSYEVTDKIQESEYYYYSPDEGSKYLVVNLTIKNLGTSASSFVDYLSISGESIICKIFYQDKYEYSSTNLLSYDADLHYKTLNPMESFTGVLVYSVPDEVASSSELNYKISLANETYVYDLVEPVTSDTEAGKEQKDSDSASSTVTIPNLVGLLSDEATKKLDDLGVYYEISYEYGGETPQSTDYIPVGEVMSQDVSAGTEIEKGSIILLIVSKGPESAATPDNPDA